MIYFWSKYNNITMDFSDFTNFYNFVFHDVSKNDLQSLLRKGLNLLKEG